MAKYFCAPSPPQISGCCVSHSKVFFFKCHFCLLAHLLFKHALGAKRVDRRLIKSLYFNLKLTINTQDTKFPA